jgi:hypothetical protein
VLTKLFLVGWSLVRIGLCSVKGLDVEGCAALVIIIAAALALPHLEPFLMMDLVYIALTAGLLALSWGFVRLCERV